MSGTGKVPIPMEAAQKDDQSVDPSYIKEGTK